VHSSLWADSAAAVPQDKSRMRQDSLVVDKCVEDSSVEELSAAAVDKLQHDVDNMTLHLAQNQHLSLLTGRISMSVALEYEKYCHNET